MSANPKRITTKVRQGAPLPVHELLAYHIDLLGTDLGNAELAAKLGYSSPNIISMLKSGQMKLPINKVATVAKVLNIDPGYLFRCVDAESNFGLTPVLDAATKHGAISENEFKLIKAMREVSPHDVNLEEHQDEFKAILAAFAIAAERKGAMFDASITRQIASRKHAAVSGTAKRNHAKTKSPDDAAN